MRYILFINILNELTMTSLITFYNSEQHKENYQFVIFDECVSFELFITLIQKNNMIVNAHTVFMYKAIFEDYIGLCWD